MLARYPEIAAAYESYILCRNQELFTIEKSVSRNKTRRIIVPWTTGLHSLPYEGGMMDQPYRMMEFFRQFIAADRKATDTRLNQS